ncbi:hypothetical protein [uncultured Dysosmobacter sp.]|uniref:hypothetical protein n=1 Tax=uncultured Dysosmobacter sp. TaxID=2591384 RepID=UPI0026182D95|nr:hypothetical protein [uncultured Dysosmobacter sp.]
MQVYLAVTPGEFQEASKYCRALAHVAYRIGPGSTLLRQNLLLQTRGGLLSVSDREAPLIEDAEALSAAVLRECSRRGYGGVVLDFEESPRRDRVLFAQRLGQVLTANRRTLYVPESYSSAAQSAVLLICTAISGGNFAERLQEAAQSRGGAGRLALDVQRLRMDFRLPARSGEGEPLGGEALRHLMERESPAVFFSQDLCARYFTYSQNGETHFVLFDDGDTLNQKLKIGASMGFSAAFLMWPEVLDIAGKLNLR